MIIIIFRGHCTKHSVFSGFTGERQSIFIVQKKFQSAFNRIILHQKLSGSYCLQIIYGIIRITLPKRISFSFVIAMCIGCRDEIVDFFCSQIEQKIARIFVVSTHHSINNAVETAFLLLFHHHVNYSRSAVGVVFCRRIGDNFDIIHRRRGNLIQGIAAAEYRRFSVDKDREI